MKKGFTMAEVLITLGIIGIVAAMTFPMMMNKYRKVVIENRLKSTLSLLNQALYLSVANNGPAYGWDYNLTTREFFDKYYAPYLKYTHVCEWSEQDSSWTEDVGLTGLKRECSSKAVTESGDKVDVNNNQDKYLLNNGVAIILGSQKERMRFGIDLNISKSEFKYGRDYFTLVTKGRDPGEVLPDDTYVSSFTYAYGNVCDLIHSNKSTSDGLTVYEHCRQGKFHWSYGDCCSAIIQCNNMEIPDDYPVRY